MSSQTPISEWIKFLMFKDCRSEFHLCGARRKALRSSCRSVKHKFRDLRINKTSKCGRAFLSVLFSIPSRGPDADHCSVSSSASHPVSDKPELCLIFARDDPLVGLVPVKD